MPEDRGFLLIDKPAGITSFDVIRALRKVSPTRRIGHCGTLDPFATGLLICAVGSYTRLISMLEELPKTYLATAKLGERTSTGDTEAEVSETGTIPSPDFDTSILSKAALSLTELNVPAHSAVKINGKRAYSLARQGIIPDMPTRPIAIHDFRIDSWKPPYLSYCCTVSKGTYIRSLSEWLAAQLGTVAHTVELRRQAIGSISVKDATAMDDIAKQGFAKRYVSPTKLFEHLPAIHADADSIRSLRNGQAIPCSEPDASKVIVIASDGSIACVAARNAGLLIPKVNIV